MKSALVVVFGLVIALGAVLGVACSGGGGPPDAASSEPAPAVPAPAPAPRMGARFDPQDSGFVTATNGQIDTFARKIAATDINGLSPSFSAIGVDAAVTTCAGSTFPTTDTCTSGAFVDAAAPVAITGPTFAVPANSYIDWSSGVMLGDFGPDAGVVMHNFVKCSLEVFAIGEQGGNVQLVPVGGSSAMTGGSLSLSPYGCTSQTGCTSSTGDAGCVVSNTAGGVTFQAVPGSAAVTVQATGLFNWRFASTQQATQRQ